MKSPLLCRHNSRLNKASRRSTLPDREAGCRAEVKLFKFFAAIFLIGVIAVSVILVTWDIPAPTEEVEKTIPNDRFQH